MHKDRHKHSDKKFEKMNKHDRYEKEEHKYAAGGAAKVRLKMATKDGKPRKACHRDDR